MKFRIARFLILAILACCGATNAQASLIITEVMSSSGGGGTPDWFELFNTGPGSENITGFRMDESGQDS